MSIPVERPYSITAVADTYPVIQVCAYDVDGPFLTSGYRPHSFLGVQGGRGMECRGDVPQSVFEDVPMHVCLSGDILSGIKWGRTYSMCPVSGLCTEMFPHSGPVSEHPICCGVSDVGMVVGDGKGKGSKLVLSPAGHSTAPFVHRLFEWSFEGPC